MGRAEPGVICDCAGAPPWPGMERLSYAAPNRYYACPACGKVRVELCRPDGSIIGRRDYQAGQHDDLPIEIVEQAQEIVRRVVENDVERKQWEQGRLAVG